MSPQHDGDNDGDNDDLDSAVGDVEDSDLLSSTASVSSSIIQYRTLRGRTYHSERYNTDYYAPNDARQNESVDISHHYLTLLLDGKLFLAPLDRDKVKRALDVGTGTGIWAIDFADEFPDTQVTGTDLSPTQPTWIPPNVRFEIDDATMDWTWPDNTFDFVHMRYLFGAIADWSSLFREAFRVTTPGGWIETVEVECVITSDDGTVTPDSALATWNKMFIEAGSKIGRPFNVLSLDVQRKGLDEAGFVDIQQSNYKATTPLSPSFSFFSIWLIMTKCVQIPMAGWPKDAKLAEVGRFVQLTMENDMEGYSSFLWNDVLGWPADEYQLFLMRTRKELRDKSIHAYITARFVYARKPE